MPPRPPHPLARTVPVPAWAVLLALLGAAGGSLAALGVGYALGRGRLPVNPAAVSRTSPGSDRAMLYDPVDRKAVAAAVIGRSTRELVEMFGPPDLVLNHELDGLLWTYNLNRSDDGQKYHGNIIIIIVNNKAVRMD